MSGTAQENGAEAADQKLLRVDAFELLDETANVPGVGRDVPGIDLMDDGEPRFITGDDTAFAARDYPDRAWADEDSVTAAGRVHWVRFRLRVDGSMKERPVFLELSTAAEAQVFVNGARILDAGGQALSFVPDPADGATISRITMPVMFAGDGQPEVIALRLDLGAGKIGARPRLDLSLHSADIEGMIQRGNLHTGLFIGVNLIIFLLAIILWSFDRADKNWLLLAAITLITAYVVLAKEADTWSMGFGNTGHDILAITGSLLNFWPSFLLILLLRRLLELTRWRYMPFYTAAVILLSVFMVSMGLVDMMSGEDLEITAETVGVGWAIVIGIASVFIGVAFVSLFIQMVRLGLKLVRSQGYVRWIGAGALFSVLAPAALGMIGGLLGIPHFSPVELVSDYFNYVGLPISVTVFLAIRSAHHNRAVARQRDDLDREVHERTAELREERDRSDELLLNILPHEVAEELKRTGAAAAKHFDQASVLFTDFKGFTTMSEQVGAAELLQELNTCFKAFDDIIGKRGIEKIKTIGDAYMCAGGLPDPKTSAPVDVVFAALEMQAFMEERRAEREAKGLLAFAMRVGIHTGPVVAGIVGVKKFQYDIWGDTVNTASRMESSGEVGQVNISESTYALVKDKPGLTFIPRGKVQAKGKGQMEMYFVQMGS